MASDDNTEEQINLLFNDLAENRALFLLNENSDKNQRLQNENFQIERKLSYLGVKELKEEE